MQMKLLKTFVLLFCCCVISIGVVKAGKYDPKDFVWESLKNRKQSLQKKYTLDELIGFALKNNPSTRQAWQDHQIALFQKKQAESQYYPEITVSGKATREKTTSTIVSHDADEFYYGPSAQASYLLFDFGGRSASVRSANYLLSAADLGYNQAVQDTILAVQQAYYDLYSANGALEAAQSDLDNAKVLYDAAQKRFEVGVVAKLDTIQAKASYENSKYLLEDAKAQLQAAKASLAAVIGVPADSNIRIVGPSDKVITDFINEKDVSRLIEDAMINRNDVASMRANVRAQEAEVEAANSALFPTVSAGGSYQKDWYKYYDTAKDRERNHSYGGYVSVDWDLFDGFNNLNEKNAAKETLEKQRQVLAQLELEVSADVWTKYYTYKSAVQKLEYAKAAQVAADDTYQLMLEGYQEGVKNILDLTSAHSTLSQANSTLVSAKRDYFVAIADLAHSIGLLNAKGKS